MQPIIKVTFLLISLLLSFALPAAASTGESLVIDDFTGREILLSNPEMMSAKTDDSSLVLSFDCSEAQKRFVHIPIGYDTDDQKVRLTISQSEHIPYMGKLEVTEKKYPIRSTYEHNYLEYQKSPPEFSLFNRHYEDLSLYFKCRKNQPGVTGTVQIDKIEIVPKTFLDDRDFAYILAAVLLIIFIVPGFFLYTLFWREGQKEQLLALLTPLSIAFFLFLYALLVANQSASLLPNGWVMLCSYITCNFLLLYLLIKKKKIRNLVANFYLVRFEMLAIFLTMMAVAALVTENLRLPLLTATYNELRYLTYGAFGALDPIFQYVNGIAIYHEEPFSKYYNGYKLFYGVQDRGMIGGVLYAVVRGIGNPLHGTIANSYGYYTLFGSLLNVLVLLPVFALHKYFFAGKERPLVIALLISASAFVVINYYITWFKLAGAGLVISGIVLLLIEKKSCLQWLLTGIIWGLATNFHPSLALTYPIVTLWLLFRMFKAREFEFTPVLLAFIFLISSFAMMNAPWAIVKSKYYPDTNQLLRQHFFASQAYSHKHGILGTIKGFVKEYSLEEQLQKRTTRVLNSFRVTEFGSLLEMTQKKEFPEIFKYWNRFEASYLAFVFAPLLLLLGLSALCKRFFPGLAWNTALTQNNPEARGLMITQCLTFCLIIVVSFGSLAPDITWHIPMSCTIIIMYLLIQKTMSLSKLGAALIIFYALFTHFRLFFSFF